MYPIFRPLLNKGGAGRSLSRADTAERLAPLVEHQGRLLVAYNQGLRQLGDRQFAAEIEPALNPMRNELGKLRETILSMGAVPPDGIGLTDRHVDLGENDADVLENLRRLEQEFRDALKDLLAYNHHQIRTIAILENGVTGSEERIARLKMLADRDPRSARKEPVAVDPVTTLPADLEHTPFSADADEQPAAQRARRAGEEG